MIRAGSSGQSGGVLGSWPRSPRNNLTKGAERLGPLEEEEMMERLPKSLAMGVKTDVSAGRHEDAKEGDIVVTTGIASWSEGRDVRRGEV